MSNGCVTDGVYNHTVKRCVVCTRSRPETTFVNGGVRACVECAPHGTRWCPHCRVVKQLSEFYGRSDGQGGGCGVCKPCAIERNAVWSRENREQARAKHAQWRRRNAEKAKEHGRANYHRHRAARRAASASASQRASRLVGGARKRARKAGLPWDESAAFRVDIQRRIDAGVCELTGLKFDFRSRGQGPLGPLAPSLDRIVPAKGYIHGNVRVVCWAVNSAIGGWGLATALEVAAALIAHREVS